MCFLGASGDTGTVATRGSDLTIIQLLEMSACGWHITLSKEAGSKPERDPHLAS